MSSQRPRVFSEEERSVAVGSLETSEGGGDAARGRVVQAEAKLRRLRGQSYRQVLRAMSDGWVAARLLDQLKDGLVVRWSSASPPAEA